ncbi:MAG: LPS export ABC transporter periplasmic protein LptC [Acidobacteria bacterium]|nr:LPS export ABC transporter periplasmic protein LptC [Acidobacteriota bacterium]
MHNRKLKIGLVLIFVALVSVVTWSYVRRAYQVYKFVSEPEKLAANVARLAKGFEYTESRDGKPVFKVVASRSVELREGAMILDQVELYKYDPGGAVTDAVKSGRATYDVQEKSVEFESEVELRLSSGITVQTQRLKADLNTQEAEILDGYFFESGKYTGRGARLHYRMQERELHMDGGVELSAADGKQGEGGYVRSKQATLMVPDNRILLSGDVFCRKGENTLRAAAVELAYDFQKRSLREVRAQQDAMLESVARGETRVLAADEIVLPVNLGRPTAFDASGSSGPARMQLRRPHKSRSLEAAAIHGQLDRGGGITALRSSQNVHFSEQPGGLDIQSGASSAAFEAGRLAAAIFSSGALLEDRARGVTLQSRDLAVAFDSAGEAQRLTATGGTRFSRAAPGTKAEDQLTADRLEVDLGPGGGIKSVEGTGNAQLQLRDPAAGSVRTVTAGRVTGDFGVAGELGGLDAENKVTLTVEQDRSRRQTHSEFLKARFAGSQIEWFQQWPDFRFQEGGRLLTGTTATYQDGLLTVTGQDQREPAVTEGEMRTTAERFLMYEEQSRLLARGRVRTVIRRDAGVGAAFPAFDKEEPVFLQSDELQLMRDEATYVGGVKAYQDNDFLFADRMVLRPQYGLVASGNVRSAFYRESRGQLQRITVQAPQLTYDRDRRVARYSEGVQMVLENATLVASLLDVHFDQNNQIEDAVAEREVELRQGDRIGTGDRLQYHFPTRRITLTGNLARVVDGSRGSASGRRLIFFAGNAGILVEG